MLGWVPHSSLLTKFFVKWLSILAYYALIITLKAEAARLLFYTNWCFWENNNSSIGVALGAPWMTSTYGEYA